MTLFAHNAIHTAKVAMAIYIYTSAHLVVILGSFAKLQESDNSHDSHLCQ